MNFRGYQQDLIDTALPLLKQHKFLYLAMEVRTGKTLTSLGVSELLPIKNLLFITKKKAISSIQDDYDALDPDYAMTVINYESLHKVNPKGWDMIILDEAHCIGAFPKPTRRAKMVKNIISRNACYVILLSGTPTPESYSQMYHQVYAIPNNPFSAYKNFYAFAKDYVKVTERPYYGGMPIKDYRDGSEDIINMMKPYTLAYTQKEAEFQVETTETVLEVQMQPRLYELIDTLKKELVLEGEFDEILGDTPVKLMIKLHQMFSGTVKFESGNSMILDLSKADFIYDRFNGQQIGIFYKFTEELNALKEVYGHRLCTELDEFNATDKTIALQIVSGREGISLEKAKALVYYNIDFSATSYWQSRDRMTTKTRLHNDIYWIFSKGGIEKRIYQAVTKKKDYTLRHFQRDVVGL